MSQCPDFTHLFVMPRIRVQNANAVSSPLTHGFPAMSAFMGLAWALERKCRSQLIDVRFSSVGVVCHGHEEQITDSGYVRAFRLTRNPVNSKGETAAIVEEGRIHLDVSLVFGVSNERWISDPERCGKDAAFVAEILAGMRVAGGSILRHGSDASFFSPRIIDMTGDQAERDANFRRLRTTLMPGFTMISREDLFVRQLQRLRGRDPDVTHLDAWLSLSRTNWRYSEATSNAKSTENGVSGSWRHDRVDAGWIVPIPVGYAALSPLYPPGTVADTRDATTPFRFVESLFSIGQWLGPHRLNSVQDMLWYVESDADTGAYRLRNDYASQFADPSDDEGSEANDVAQYEFSTEIFDLDD